jgi:hypothetical protein
MGENERGLGGEGAQQMRDRLIVQAIEAVPERFAVQGHRMQTCLRRRSDEVTCVAAEGGFEIGRVKGQQQIAQRVERRSAAEPATEDVVQALAMHPDEGDDALIRGRPRQDR